MRVGSRLAAAGKVLAFNLLAILVGGELMAYAVVKWRHAEGYGSIRLVKEEFLRRVPRPHDSGELERRAGAAGTAPDNIPRELHPFFGFTYEGESARYHTNNMGFLADVDVPYQKQRGEFVVGVFGGSVAADLRLPEPKAALERQLGDLVRAKGYDNVRVIVFAEGGWRQPATGFSWLYYEHGLDMAIFLDGFNEIGHLPMTGAGVGDYPWDFPPPNVWRPLAQRGDTMEQMLAEQQLGDLRRLEVRATGLASRGLLARSMLVHMCWRAAISVLERRVDALSARMGEGGTRHYRGFLGPRRGLEQGWDLFFERYARFVEDCYQVGRIRAKPVAHFIQPNQYLAGSKPYSSVEREVALARAPTSGKRVGLFYPYLARMVAALRERGVPSEDLSWMFAADSETRYKDSCCHLNDSGMIAIVDEMVRRIEGSGILAMVPEAPR